MSKRNIMIMKKKQQQQQQLFLEQQMKVVLAVPSSLSDDQFPWQSCTSALLVLLDSNTDHLNHKQPF